MKHCMCNILWYFLVYVKTKHLVAYDPLLRLNFGDVFLGVFLKKHFLGWEDS